MNIINLFQCSLCIYTIFGHYSIASFIVERQRAEYTKKLWASEMKLEDLEALDEARDGGGEMLYKYVVFVNEKC